MTDVMLDPVVEARIRDLYDALPTDEHRAAVDVMLAAHAAQIEIDTNRARWLADPTAWAWERCGIMLWSKQQEIVDSVRDHKRTAVRSCNAVGKSFVAATTIAWWMDCHRPGSAFVVSTAPTFAQVRAILWRELRSLHRKGGLSGRVNNTEWIDDNGDIVGYGRKPADHDAVGFLGIHARYVLVVLDEAGGVPKSLWDATESIATNDESRILAIGNPDDPATPFAAVSNQPALWNPIQVSAYDAPNFTGEEVSDAVRHNTVTPQWADDAATRWGVDSPLFISRVMGEFPVDASDTAVRLGDVVANCVNVDPPYDGLPGLLTSGPVCLGVDIGGGGDYTVVRERRGKTAYRSWAALTTEPALVADLVLKALVITSARTVNYDATGLGWAVGEVIKERLNAANIHGVVINPINFGAAAIESDKYKNRRAEMIIGIGREFSREGAWYLGAMVDGDTGLPNGDDTIAQLIDQKYSTVTGGRLQVEPKEDIIKRTGRSPDDSDALLLAFVELGGPTTIQSPVGQLPTGAESLTRSSTGRKPGGGQLPSRAGVTRRR